MGYNGLQALVVLVKSPQWPIYLIHYVHYTQTAPFEAFLVRKLHVCICMCVHALCVFVQKGKVSKV